MLQIQFIHWTSKYMCSVCIHRYLRQDLGRLPVDNTQHHRLHLPCKAHYYHLSSNFTQTFKRYNRQYFVLFSVEQGLHDKYLDKWIRLQSFHIMHQTRLDRVQLIFMKRNLYFCSAFCQCIILFLAHQIVWIQFPVSCNSFPSSYSRAKVSANLSKLAFLTG